MEKYTLRDARRTHDFLHGLKEAMAIGLTVLCAMLPHGEYRGAACSPNQRRGRFFLIGTAVCSGAYFLLTYDTLRRVPTQTQQDRLSAAAIRGKHLREDSNCMGCHTLMVEGGYYAPERAKVYERRGETFVRAMLKDPEQLYPG